jgi:hypothetical protein
MFCKDCGTELVNGACPKCTSDFVEVKPKKKGFALAIVCMITGIASIVLNCGIVGSIAAFITGAIYKKKNGESHAMVKVGTTFGILGIIWQVVVFALIIVIYLAYYALIAGILLSTMQ